MVPTVYRTACCKKNCASRHPGTPTGTFQIAPATRGTVDMTQTWLAEGVDSNAILMHLVETALVQTLAVCEF